MHATTEDTLLLRTALAYVGELYRELTQQNGTPILGIQNQAVEFILADPGLREAVKEWGRQTEIAEASTEPPHRLPIDDAYRRIRQYLEDLIPQSDWTRWAQARE
jgi:hypothetical protein